MSLKSQFETWLQSDEGAACADAIPIDTGDELETAYRAGWHACQLDIAQQLGDAVEKEMDALKKP